MSEDWRAGANVGKIAFILEPCDTVSHDILRQVAEVRVGRSDRKYTEEELIAGAWDVDALLITSRDGVSRRVMEGCQRLRLIAKVFVRREADPWVGCRPWRLAQQPRAALGI